MLGNIISAQRKKLGLTQEQLAQKLDVTNQAVSKWETDQSCPDVAMLPRLAELFGISMDELFGRELSVRQMVRDLPWEDDEAFRIVLYRGRELVRHSANAKEFTFKYDGHAREVYSELNIQCGKVDGHAVAEGYIECGDVGGYVMAGSYVECSDVGKYVCASGYVECASVGGNVSSDNSYVECQDVGGSIRCAGYVECGNVGGDVNAGGYAECNAVEGSVCAGSYIECDDVEGSVSAGSYVECGDVGGNISAGDYVECGNVGGSVQSSGNVECGSIGIPAAGRSKVPGSGCDDCPGDCDDCGCNGMGCGKMHQNK